MIVPNHNFTLSAPHPRLSASICGSIPSDCGSNLDLEFSAREAASLSPASSNVRVDAISDFLIYDITDQSRRDRCGETSAPSVPGDDDRQGASSDTPRARDSFSRATRAASASAISHPNTTARVTPSDDGGAAQGTTADTNEASLGSDALSPPITDDRSLITDHWLTASQLSAAIGVHPKTIHNRAKEQKWPARYNGYRFEYLPPESVLRICVHLRSSAVQSDSESASDASVQFTTGNNEARAMALKRKQALDYYQSLLDAHIGIESALIQTCAHFSVSESFSFSTRTLRRWINDHRDHGMDGLVDQKSGRSGRRPASDHLTDDMRRHYQARAQTLGSISRATREMMVDPELPAALRLHVHEGHASKSHVTGSIRDALEISEATNDLIQGPRNARLKGRFTPRDYTNLKAGEIFVSDDMTSNVLCWVEWPSAKHGWRIGQAQILPVMDVGSLRWLNFRAIMRDGGQYSSDDIWGLFGDVFDTFGLPARGFLLEGGHWQSNRVIGHAGDATGLTDDERIGGLASLGLQMFRSYDPRSKGMLEGAFNQLQHVMDSCPGYAGRDQRTQMPEAVKKQKALCEGGHNHPREFFPHISQLADHIKRCMEQLNHERQDGQILRGQSSLEKWASDGPRLSKLPPTATWMYRSAMNKSKVTKNGVRITQGTGAKQDVYYYDNPSLLVPRQGTKVLIYWNDKNPDADCAILDAATRVFIGLAQRVQNVPAFDATDDQLAAEAVRKREATKYARTEMRAIQDHLQRRHVPAPIDQPTAEVGSHITAAADRVEKEEREKKTTKHRQAAASHFTAAALLDDD